LFVSRWLSDVDGGGHRLIFDVESRGGFDEAHGEQEITRREEGGALNTVAVENPAGEQ
jgi:hypothetical protein